ncbi:MAG: hypothetical protein KatS3mg001_207 [Candidatus Pacearchaeota archaeon]|nr:MAG: hypothetical protein KatS3mg001_207 [Candidatus Pacearchaeota archaeon]
MKKKRKVSFVDVLPIETKLDSHDLLQIIIGSSLLAIPIGFTQETWEIGGFLPLTNILALALISIIFLVIFTYVHYHQEHINSNPKRHIYEMLKRVFATYIISFFIVGLFLQIINVADWTNNLLVSFKRTVVVNLPSSMGAALSDRLK